MVSPSVIVAAIGSIIAFLIWAKKVGEKAKVSTVEVTRKHGNPNMPNPRSQVFASGTMLVTGTGEIVIDEVLPPNKAFLEDPDAYVTVEFDPNSPVPAPCVVDLPDECDWTLFFKHVHDTHLNHHQKAEELKLKVQWRVASSRTLIWQIRVPR